MAKDLDGRFSIRKEWCGEITQKWVVRWCGDWVGRRENRSEAEDLAREFYTQKFGYAPKTEQEWREWFASRDNGASHL